MPPSMSTASATPVFQPGRALMLGDHRQSLVVARSLHNTGYRVSLGSSEEPSTVRSSRHVSGWWCHPSMSEEPQRFNAALAAWMAVEPGGVVLFPVGDGEVAGIAARLGRLPPNALVVMADREAVALCHDKPALYRVARQAGLAVADFEVVAPARIDEAIARIGYPCVVKPASSVQEQVHLKALLLEGPPERPLGPSLEGQGWLAIVQRKMPGVRHNCHFVAHQGRLLAYFEQSVQRTTRADGCGNGVDGRSEAPSETRRRACERLLAVLNYSGPGCVQFLVDEQQGGSWLLELNPRLDATCAIAAHCGYDLPRLAVQESLHRMGLMPLPQPVTTPYPVGRRGVWTTGNLRALLSEVEAHRIGLKDVPGWLARTAMSCATADLHLTFAWEDPEPALRAMLGLLLGPVRRLKRLVRARA